MALILDTSVISELTRPQPDAGVRAWIAGLPAWAPLALNVITVAELHGAELVTRNLRDFEQCGVTLINPFQDRA